MQRRSHAPRVLVILSLLPILLAFMVVLTPAAPVSAAEDRSEVNSDAGSENDNGQAEAGDDTGAAEQVPEPTGQSSQESPYTAAPLPTAQIDGVAWGQLVVGDVIYS